MTAVRTHAPAQRTYTVEVAPPVGKPVALRVRGMTFVGAGAAQSKPSATLSASTLSSVIKTALEPATQRRTAHVARVMPTGAALELPGPLQTIANAAQALPDALKGTLIRGAVAVVGPRLAALTLPTVTLAAALYPPQMGDASLPVPSRAHEAEPNATSTAYVPLAPQGLKHAEGFKPLAPSDAVLAGIPDTEITRPRTPLIRDLPISNETKVEPLAGGAPVDLPAVPGRARWVQQMDDLALLAERSPETPSATSSSSDAPTAPEKTKYPLTFSDVTVTVDEGHRDRLQYRKTLRLNFQAGIYGEGNISIRWVEPDTRYVVEANVQKSEQLPPRLAGEILARALGYEEGFIPARGLWLRVVDQENGELATQEAIKTIGQWALALNGKRWHRAADGFRTVGEHARLDVRPGFRATTHLFATPNVISGAASTGPGLDEPKVFPSLAPSSHSLSSDPRVMDIRSHAQSMRDYTASIDFDPRPGFYQSVYVIPVPRKPGDAPQILVPTFGSPLAHPGHPYAAQEQNVWAAGEYDPVFDPDWPGNVRVQWIHGRSGHYQTFGRNPKETSEAEFQRNKLDGDGRFFSFDAMPVSTDPFAGLVVEAVKSISGAHSTYVIRIPDARALEVKGKTPEKSLAQKSKKFEDLASLKLEPIEGRPGLVRIHDGIQLDSGMRAFLPTLVGQALAAVSLDAPHTGLVISRQELRYWSERDPDAFANGLTIYGLERGLGEYSPEVPFVLRREMSNGDVELTINPAVRTSR